MSRPYRDPIYVSSQVGNGWNEATGQSPTHAEVPPALLKEVKPG